RTIVTALLVLVLAGCAGQRGATQQEIDARNQALRSDIELSIAEFKRTDPTMQELFETAHGYAVFPRVSKGGLVFGGSYGYGQVFEGGRLVGEASITKISVGLQAGGQVFREVIFFKDPRTLTRFKGGEFALSAEATAAAAADGVAASADYAEGVTVFVMPIKGLMVEASIGGQKFNFTPVVAPPVNPT
ncbi:MAG: YSC84-related protein, partial [Pseudomonadota bacterium]